MKVPSMPGGVHLVSLPFTSLQSPNLGLSLLAAGVRQQGIACEIHYLAFDFAETIGVESYAFLSHEKFYQAFLGEWIFSALVYERPEALDMEYLAEVVPDFATPLETVLITHVALAARKAAAGFIDRCAKNLAARQPGLVGITTSFQQNMASIAFANALKRHSPETTILFGGANCEAELGTALLQSFDCIDAVCSGEGDTALPAFVEAFAAGDAMPEVPGITTRNCPSDKQPGRMITALDNLPIPDFSDFYSRFDRTSGLKDLLQPTPTIETSRGCWWGAKHHCTFCGLNGNAMTYRSKSPDRALKEFRTQARIYGSDFIVVDNILDYAYFDSLLPMLRDDPTPFLMHFEVKSNLFPKHIQAMAAAGIRKIQPGIETLDSHILKLMKKGVNALQNIQTLKLCAEAGIFVDWGFIFGFPGEDPSSYDRMADLMSRLHHLQPPAAFAPVRADRFSPYFTRPHEFGIQLKPAKPYRFIYAGVGDELGRFSYHHEMSAPDIDHAQTYTRRARDAVQHWITRHSDARFYIADDTGETMILHDSRDGGEETRTQLSRLEADIVRLCACMNSEDRVRVAVAPRHGMKQCAKAIDRLLERGILAKENKSLLALPLAFGTFGKAPTWAEIRSEVLHQSHHEAGPPVRGEAFS